MRGFAALYVLGLHVVSVYAAGRTTPGGPFQGFLIQGWIGVDFFFVLSGFLLALPLLARPESMKTPGFFRNYVSKRWWRIAPPYYISIFATLAIVNQMDYLADHPGDVLLHLGFLHAFNSYTLTSIDPVYWTLASEFQFYLVLPLFVLLLRQRTWPVSLAAMGLVTLAWRAATYHGVGTPSWVSFTFPAFLLHFAFGVLAARAYLTGFRLPVKASLAIPTVVGALIVAPLVLLGAPLIQGTNSLTANMVLRPLIALGFAMVIFLTCSDASLFRRIFSSRPMVVLGDQSYSLYLIHVPILYAVTQVPFFVHHGLWAYMAAGVVASLAGSTLFYGLVERPSLVVREWMVSRSARGRPSIANPNPMPTFSAEGGPVN
jgi:peptidoglycan/LPS O-acetylase OafA/YrhL